MNLTAALDIGTEKIVMAVAEETGNGNLRLSGMKMIASQGVEKGLIKEKAKLRSYIHYLLKELDKQQQVKKINVMLSYPAMQISEHKVNVPVQRRVVKRNDIIRAELKCREMMSARAGVLIDLIPVAYYIDREQFTLEPEGKAGKELDVRFRVYKAEHSYLSDLQDIFKECGIKDVNFYPPTKAYMKAMEIEEEERSFALVDMGGAHTGVILFKSGLPVREVSLSLGTATVDKDIMSAFRFEDPELAKKLKHNHGEAIRSFCGYERIQIPELSVEIHKKDLIQTIQCRLEELLEGAVYQLQQWKFVNEEESIFLTGGGCKLPHTGELLNRISGQKAVVAKAQNVVTENNSLLEATACTAVLGLLSCSNDLPEESKGKLGGWFSGWFK